MTSLTRVSSFLLTVAVCALAGTEAFVIGTLPSSRPASSLRSSLMTEVASEYSYLLDTYPLATQAVTASVLAGVGDVLAQVRQESLPIRGSTLQRVDLERLRRFMLKGLGGGVIWSYWYGLNEEWTNALLVQEFMEQTDGSCLNLMTILFTMGGGTVETLAGAVSVDLDATVDAAQTLGDLSQQSTVPSSHTMQEDHLPSLTADSLPLQVTLGRTAISILLEQFVAVPLIFTFWEIPVPTLLSSTQDNGSIPDQIRTKLPPLLISNAKVWTFANFLVYTMPLQYRMLVSSMFDIVWQSIVSGHVMTKEEGRVLTEQQDQLIIESILGQEAAADLTGNVETGSAFRYVSTTANWKSWNSTEGPSILEGDDDEPWRTI